jgi:2-amino-4-hydroxy-6-hydroxymethyldihydropteridine diphosphokinase
MNDSRVLGEYQDRIIDIDIVYYDALEFKSNRLRIPHLAHLKREFSIELLEKFKQNKT